jgi:hypothetical protein
VDKAALSLQFSRNGTLPALKSRLLTLQPPQNTAFVVELVAQAALYIVRPCPSSLFKPRFLSIFNSRFPAMM